MLFHVRVPLKTCIHHFPYFISSVSDLIRIEEILENSIIGETLAHDLQMDAIEITGIELFSFIPDVDTEEWEEMVYVQVENQTTESPIESSTRTTTSATTTTPKELSHDATTTTTTFPGIHCSQLKLM